MYYTLLFLLLLLVLEMYGMKMRWCVSQCFLPSVSLSLSLYIRCVRYWTHNTDPLWNELAANVFNVWASRKEFSNVAVVAFKMALLLEFMCALFVAHSPAHIFILPSTKTKGKIRILLSMFQTHIKLTCVVLCMVTGALLLCVSCKDEIWLVFGWMAGSLSLSLVLCWFSILKIHWTRLSRRKIYRHAFRYCVSWRKIDTFDMAWLQFWFHFFTTTCVYHRPKSNDSNTSEIYALQYALCVLNPVHQ